MKWNKRLLMAIHFILMCYLIQDELFAYNLDGTYVGDPDAKKPEKKDKKATRTSKAIGVLVGISIFVCVVIALGACIRLCEPGEDEAELAVLTPEHKIETEKDKTDAGRLSSFGYEYEEVN